MATEAPGCGRALILELIGYRRPASEDAAAQAVLELPAGAIGERDSVSSSELMWIDVSNSGKSLRNVSAGEFRRFFVETLDSKTH